MTAGVLIGNKDVVDGNILTDYSFVATNLSSGLIAGCMTGLGPSGDSNGDLGGWCFNGSQIPLRGCMNSNNIIQPVGAKISKIVGLINLRQCQPLTTLAEGVYWCMMMNSSMMYEVKGLGVYLSGRSESLAHIHVCVSYLL